MIPTQPLERQLLGMPIVVAAAFAYIASAVGQYGLAVTGIPPYVGEILAQLMLLSVIGLSLTRPRIIAATNNKSFAIAFALVILFFVWMLLSFLYSSESSVARGALVQNSRALLMMMSFALAIVYSPASMRATCLTAAGLVVLGCLINVQDFIQPTYSGVPGRAAGFYINPNVSGTMLVYLAVLGSMSLAVVPTYVLWSLASVAIALTFSRSAWLMLFIALIGMALLGRLGTGRGRIIFVTIVSAVLALVLLTLLSGDLYEFISQSSLAEFLNPNTIARLGASGSVVDDFSVLERQSALAAGWQAFLESPLLGKGLGYTLEWSGRVSTHNMFVLFLAERGVIGCLLYIALLMILILRTSGSFRLLALLIAVEGFFTHNQLDEMSDIAVIGLVIGSLAWARQPASIEPPPAGRAILTPAT